MCDDDVAALVVDNGALVSCEINNCGKKKKHLWITKYYYYSTPINNLNGSLKMCPNTR